MKVAVIGAGVIGQGWAVRFASFGWDVAVYDQNPDAAVLCQRLLNNARDNITAVYGQLPSTGRIVQRRTVSQAVDGAHWIQESVPERLPSKKCCTRKLPAVSPSASLQLNFRLQTQ